VDLNNDGYTDIVTIVSGKCLPDDVIWFKGNKKGFEKGIIIKDMPEIDRNDMNSNVSTPYFADIDGDKDLDMFIAASDGVFFNRNIGTPENPKFGGREILTTINSNSIKANTTSPTIAIVDWDNDNILDIIITTDDGRNIGLSYHKGLKNEKFEVAIPIAIGTIGIKNENNKRYIPGCDYWICSTDWNNDRKPDLLVGSSLAYKNGKILDDINNSNEDFYDQFISNGEIDQKKVGKFYKNVKTYGVVYLLLRE
jgi:hypothetical protein